MTAQWKGWPIASCRSSPSSTTRRHGQDRGTTCTSSETSWRRSRGRSPRGGGGAMPKREDVKTAMVIGSGPIVIGQEAEFDYSGSQACRSLREEGVRVVLVNSNPATVQTDPDTADAVYVEPLTVAFLEKVIAKERPQGILCGMGGQTALNLCSELSEAGILGRHGVELLGTKMEAITAGENRERFASLMRSIGEPIPRSRAVSDSATAATFVEGTGYPVIVRAAYTLGGSGSGVAHNAAELDRIVGLGLAYSRIKQVLVEESVLGWKEFEYEVMRDASDNCITICNMENLDPMGIHTGESIVVAPAQTLSDADHQTLRSAALRIVRARIEGDRLSHRTHRRQDRDRSPPRRDPEPGHRENAGFLRAHPRLRRHEDSPMAVRQIPDGRPAHWHVDEKHRGSHGDRPDVRGVLPEGGAVPRD